MNIAKKKYTPLIVLVIGIIIIVLYYVSLYSLYNGSRASGVYIDNQALDFGFIDFNGGQHRLSDFRGRVVVLEFMASWCPPCKVEVQYLKELNKLYEGKVVIISISLDTDDSSARNFWMEYNVSWYMTRNTTIGSMYGVYYIPTLLIIDKDGVIRFREEGLTSFEELVNIVDRFV